MSRVETIKAKYGEDWFVKNGQNISRKVKEIYGEDYYQNIGRKGGIKSRGGGFAANRALARKAGRKGGKISKRG